MSVAATWTAAPPPTVERSLFGDFVLLAFLIAQSLDGVFTYVGVITYGLDIEANPLLATLMASFGHGLALTGAKLTAAALGICLHLRQIHFTVAIVPWMMILFSR
jgi:uncharacterized membrane protein